MKKNLLSLLLLLPSITLAQEYLKQFPLRQQAQYFDFHFKRNPGRVAAIARFADGFVQVVNRDFFKADFDYPIRVLVLEDRATFQEFLRREFRVNDPPGFGIYLPPPHKLFATYEDSGLGTFAHEIMHPLVERNLKDRPAWAMEGIPGFFEKFYGYWQQDKLTVHWGYQNPWRIQVLGTNLVRLDLKAILASTENKTQYNQSDLRMVSVFLWEQGRFKRFIQLIEKGEKNGYKSYFEAAMEMPVERVLPLWQSYLRAVAADARQIMRLPPSTILDDERAFRTFKVLHELKVPPSTTTTNAVSSDK